MKVRVQYEATPIRHIAVQCPECGRWYRGNDISEQRLSFDHDIYNAQFTCPVCGKVFGADACTRYSNVQVEECDDHMAVYKGCLYKTEVWQ